MLQLTPSLPRTDTLFTVTTRSRSRPGRRERTGHGGRLMSLPARFSPQALLRLAAGLLVAAVVIVVVTVPLDLESQWIFALTTMAGVLLFNRSPGKRSTIAIGLLSLLVSTRYLFWRTTHTLD